MKRAVVVVLSALALIVSTVIVGAPAAQAGTVKYRIGCATDTLLGKQRVTCFELKYVRSAERTKRHRVQFWSDPQPATAFTSNDFYSHKKSYHIQYMQPDRYYRLKVGRLRPGKAITMCVFPKYSFGARSYWEGVNPKWGSNLLRRVCVSTGPLR